MSTDTHRQTMAGFRCEAVTTDTIASPCVHSRLANTSRLEATGLDRSASHADDPAVLIGLALAFVRQGPLLNGPVPEPLTLRLSSFADEGNAACRLLVKWLQNRNRDFRPFADEQLTREAPAMASTDTHHLRRSPRERVLAPSAKPGHLDGRRPIRTRPRDPVRNLETAIIATETGGRVDG